MFVPTESLGPCERCGTELLNTNKTLHRKVCDKIPPGKELPAFVEKFPAFPMLEFDYYFMVPPGKTKEYLHKQGWSTHEIKKRNAFSKDQLSIIDTNIAGPGIARGSRNRFKARCLRCEILLFSENIPARFCRYCKKENELPKLAKIRDGLLDVLVEARYLEIRQGGLSFGWDGTMSTYFAFVLPTGSSKIPVWSIGNAPLQMVTLNKFGRVLELMGVEEHREVVKMARKFKKVYNKPFSTRVDSYVSSSQRYEET